DNTDQYAQAYFAYDSKKSGGVTVSHLRFGKKPIRSTYLINKADFVACHNSSYITKYDMVSDLKDNGIFLINCGYSVEELEKVMPAAMKRIIAQRNIDVYTIDAVSIGAEIGLGNRVNMVMQAAFFKLANIIPLEDAVQHMKDAVYDTYGKKGEKIINMNLLAIDKGIEGLHRVEVPAGWADAVDAPKEEGIVPDFITNIMEPINRQEGDKLPVSAFIGREDGTFPVGTAAYEKRGIAIDVPVWIMDNCIQCNQCSYVCPHAAIRPFLMDEVEVKNAPASFLSKKAIGKDLKEFNYRIQITPLDCTGCASCFEVCPSKEKSLVMMPLQSQMSEIENWEYALTLEPKDNVTTKDTVKGSQFQVPLFEFSGACAGCGETPYLKLVTQLFGDRMMAANATGCTSIYSASAPSMPYTTNKKGHGPAWSNSLFEDSAEFGFGMYVGVKQIRNKLADLCQELLQADIPADLKDALDTWLEKMLDGEDSKAASANLVTALESYKATDEKLDSIAEEILDKKEFLVKKSQWIYGGDGWGYDIGFGGLDHVLASHEDVNILLLDTEVYSNTGGQSSKSTPTGAVAQFAVSGKETKKKDLGMMIMSYGYVYVAQVAMGASQTQLIKAMTEAERYPGPSLIIAYAPCINHGLKMGMGRSQLEQKRAVEAGYWHLYRYNPLLKEDGKNPFILDSKEPIASYRDFIMGESRYSTLINTFPQRAESLFTSAEKSARERYESYRRMADWQG
ncbi:MAG: pyruvate:ferredoxin (flavodoxin) oxidoreductase, partial [Syntrophomonadaceae bacterium]|nr:pyruvate:ferredoxin (flavodoxin) oxidoreductase [Syntrophomonadaceae bacterium]